MSCGAGRRHGFNPALLWLWCRLAATALIRPLAWEHPYAMDTGLKTHTHTKKFFVWLSFLLPLANVKCLIFCHRPMKALPQGLHLMVGKDIICWSPDLMRSRDGRLVDYLALLFKHSPVNFWLLLQMLLDHTFIHSCSKHLGGSRLYHAPCSQGNLEEGSQSL